MSLHFTYCICQCASSRSKRRYEIRASSCAVGNGEAEEWRSLTVSGVLLMPEIWVMFMLFWEVSLFAWGSSFMSTSLSYFLPTWAIVCLPSFFFSKSENLYLIPVTLLQLLGGTHPLCWGATGDVLRISACLSFNTLCPSFLLPRLSPSPTWT